MKTKVKFLTVDQNSEGQRIDNFLIRELKIPKSRIYQMLRTGEVRINKGRVRPADKLALGDEVRIPPYELSVMPEETAVQARHESLLVNIIYEDEFVLILNKPSGFAVHGGSGIHAGVIEAMKLLRPDIRFLELAHRLDKETSGCLILAKSRVSLLHLHELFKTGKVKKIYHAWVAGHWPKNLNKVNCKLQRNQQVGLGRKVRVVKEDEEAEYAKESLTTFAVLKYLDDSTQLEVRLHTGRMHQIRVHCQMSGYPIIGDDRYGKHALNQVFAKKGMKRLYLHCHRMSFNLPNGKELSVTAEPTLW